MGLYFGVDPVILYYELAMLDLRRQPLPSDLATIMRTKITAANLEGRMSATDAQRHGTLFCPMPHAVRALLTEMLYGRRTATDIHTTLRPWPAAWGVRRGTVDGGKRMEWRYAEPNTAGRSGQPNQAPATLITPPPGFRYKYGGNGEHERWFDTPPFPVQLPVLRR